MIKFMIVFFVCVLLIQSGCNSDLDVLLSRQTFEQKTELEKQKDERRFTQFKDMMCEDY